MLQGNLAEPISHAHIFIVTKSNRAPFIYSTAYDSHRTPLHESTDPFSMVTHSGMLPETGEEGVDYPLSLTHSDSEGLIGTG